MGLTAGAAARATELRKHEANDGKCRELGWVCVPMVVEAYGAWGAEAMESLSCLASRLATSSNKAYTHIHGMHQCTNTVTCNTHKCTQ